MIGEEVAALVDEHLPADDQDGWDMEALLRAIKTIDPMLPASITAESFETKTRNEIESELVERVEQAYKEREQAIQPEQMRFVERRMMLAAIDRQWVDYLTAMDDLRQAIGLEAFAQRDPLVEFKRKSFDMFDELKANITHDIVYNIVPASFQYEQYLRQIELEQEARLASAQRVGETEEAAKAAKPTRRTVQMPGRNDPCPCGSGKKFKQCHLGREGEIMHLIQAGVTAPPAPASVSAQLAMGRNPGKNDDDVAAVAEAIKKANASNGQVNGNAASVKRGRSVPSSASASGAQSGSKQPTARGKKK
jgi:preprotein translocase subunit SecA